MSYPDDAEYPYVDLAELADIPPSAGIDPDAFREWCDIVEACEEGHVRLYWTEPTVPEDDDE